MKLKEKFAQANATHDGHLTRAQAAAAGMTQIANNFATIDAHGEGFVTLDQVLAFRDEKRVALEKRYNVPPKTQSNIA